MGKNENELAQYLASRLEKLGVKFFAKVETNQVFIILENNKIEELSKNYGFEMWERGENESCIRLVISFATKQDVVDIFLQDLKDILF